MDKHDKGSASEPAGRAIRPPVIAKGRRRLKGAWLVAVIVLIGAGGVGYWLFGRAGVSAQASPGIRTFTARRDTLEVTVTESGSLRAHNSIDLMSDVEGQVTILSIVPEGTTISPKDVNDGRILVELDSSRLTEELAPREIDYATAEAQFTGAKESYDIQLNQNESDLASASLKVRFALMDFQRYLGEAVAERVVRQMTKDEKSVALPSVLEDPNLGGEASQRLRELNSSIALAEANLKKAASTLEWTQKLFEKQYVAKTELEKDQLDHQRLDIETERSRTALDLFRRYEFPKQAEQFWSDCKESNRELERTRAKTRSLEAQARAQMKSAEAEFRLRQDRLDKVKRQITACTIKAPAPGLVVYSSSGDSFGRRMERRIEEGATVYERQKIITLPDTSEMVAEIRVHESWVDKVRRGQKATITVDAFPDKTFTGEVLKVSPLPDAQRNWMSPDLKVYATDVNIAGSHEYLRPGMSVKVEVLVERLDDVVIVPVNAVASRQGVKECHVVTSDGSERRQIVTGSFNKGYVQVVSGLNEGEQVLLNPPRVTTRPAVASAKRGGGPAGPSEESGQPSQPAAAGPGRGRRGLDAGSPTGLDGQAAAPDPTAGGPGRRGFGGPGFDPGGGGPGGAQRQPGQGRGSRGARGPRGTQGLDPTQQANSPQRGTGDTGATDSTQ